MNPPTVAALPARPTGCPFSGPSTAPVQARRTPGGVVAPPAGPVADPAALARQVLEVLRRTGKHFLPDALLTRLDDIRRGPAAGDPYLSAFLDSVLDKHDGRFQNRTYLALPLLEAMLDDPATGMDPDRLSALLMSDVIRFEIGAAAAPDRADDLPDARTLRTRLQHARRFVDHCLIDRCTDDPFAGLPTPAGAVADWLHATVQPVYVLHDEYFFIRVLQCHELTFTVLVADVRAAVRAVREGAPDVAAARLSHADDVFARAVLLFRIVATMRAATFHAFRDFTQGASAIQSDQYKRFEAACGSPEGARLRSEAFAGVPAVRAEVLAGQDSLCRAYLDARRDLPGHPGWEPLDAALRALERSHQRWKTTHRALAARMLGAAPGSGYTAGVPYLDRCLENRLFRPLGDRSSSIGRRG